VDKKLSQLQADLEKVKADSVGAPDADLEAHYT